MTQTQSSGPRPWGPLREPVNALTHAAGVVLGVIGLVALLVLAGGEPWRTVSAAVYGATLIVLFSASTVMHAARVEARTLKRLRILDHAAIFLLIAGSYTPVALVTLQAHNAVLGWTLLAVVWGLALAGVAFKLLWIGAPRWISTGLYLALGWLAVLAIVPLAQALPTGGLAWLLAGGIVYSLGAVIYASKRPDPWPRWFGYHGLWHLFVLGGSVCHFVMIARYVVAA